MLLKTHNFLVIFCDTPTTFFFHVKVKYDWSELTTSEFFSDKLKLSILPICKLSKQTDLKRKVSKNYRLHVFATTCKILNKWRKKEEKTSKSYGQSNIYPQKEQGIGFHVEKAG